MFCSQKTLRLIAKKDLLANYKGAKAQAYRLPLFCRIFVTNDQKAGKYGRDLLSKIKD